MRPSAALLVGSLVLALGVACSSSESGDSGASGGAGGVDPNFVLFDQGGAAATTGSGDGCSAPSADPGCVGERFEGESVPLDIYVMFDSSASMDCTIEARQPWPNDLCNGSDPRIAPVRRAITDFLSDPASAGIGVGIGYFGDMPMGQTSCSPTDYADPDVPIAALPGNADALIRSLDAARPTGETPTGAAIRGACGYLASWHTQHPSHHVVLLLVTDGVPETPLSNQCRPPASIDDAVGAATQCGQGSPSIPTYVVGVGQALDNLNQIASAGGTNRAFLVDGGDVGGQVLAALNQIRGEAQIPCELVVPQPPDGEELSLDLVNVGICDATGQSVGTYRVDSPSECGTGRGGWYYLEAGTGTRVVLCEPTCQTVEAAGASLFYSIGCQTTVVPR